MKGTILLNEGPGALRGLDLRRDILREAYEVEVAEAETIEATLERIFRAANRVDGSAVEQVPDGERSLSVGDVVWLPENDKERRAYAVATVGFEAVDWRSVLRRTAPLAGQEV